MTLLITLLYFVFVFAAIVLVVVILLQEGKGGGFGEALGSHGQETFGVGAKGIQTFTAVIAGVFLFSALAIHVLNRFQSGSSVVSDSPAFNAIEGDAAPAEAPAGLPAGGE